MIRVVYVGGPTGCGKSALALELARRFGGEIVNADSQQVYRGLDVGTGKPSADERGTIPHHLFDLAEPGEQLDAARWCAEADRTLEEIHRRGRVPFVVGGTGLWMRALYKGLVDAPPRDEAVRTRLEQEAARSGLAALHERLSRVDPESAARIHATDPVRIIRALEVYELGGIPLSELHRRHAAGAPRHDALHLALDRPADVLEARLRQRVDAMFVHGLLEETRRLSSTPEARRKLERVMGYREALALLDGRLTREEAKAKVFLEHRRYAKRQRTWLRAEPWWTWVPGDAASSKSTALVEAFLSSRPASR